MADKDRIIRAFGKLNMRVTGGQEHKGSTQSSNKSLKPQKHAVVLFCGSDISLSKAYEGLRELRNDNWRLTAIFSKSAERLISEDSVCSAIQPDKVLKESEGVSVQMVRDIDALIVPNMTQNTLAKLSVGIQDELTALITWQALVSNKPVVVSTDSIFKGWFDIDQNKAMKRVMQNHVNALKGFGAKLADQHEYVSLLSSKEARKPVSNGHGRAQIGTKSDIKSGVRVPNKPNNRSVRESLSVTDAQNKKLLTEKDIKMLNDVTELTLGKGQILTPLGRDAAISKGIRIIYQRQ